MQRLGSAHHTERGYQSYQSEAVVTVQMGDEHAIQPCRLQHHATKPYLATLAAVNHERLVAKLQHLTGRGVLKRGQSAAAT